ncbi:PIN-like domain-containing protein [Planobispora longispora]|nr:PIN domain-containing protein [Planobispora longispora]
MRTQFSAYYPPGEELYRKTLNEGLIVLDTNVLLSLYRYLPEARDELFAVLGSLGKGLWIPYQVAHEFYRNRFSVIKEQGSLFKQYQDSLETLLNDYISHVNAFANRVALGEEAKKEIVDRVRKAHEFVEGKMSKMSGGSQLQHFENADKDHILERIEALFDGKLGPAFEEVEHREAVKEAERRIKDKIPPGYKDRGKDDPSGDYLVWAQIKVEASSRKVPTLFVTDDVKEDWWRREHGLTLGPRPELYREMEKASGAPFLLMTTKTFLLNAQKFLSSSISPATVEAAGEIASSDLREKLEGEDLEAELLSKFSLQIYRHYESLVAKTLVGMGLSVHRRPHDGPVDFTVVLEDGRSVDIVVKYVSPKVSASFPVQLMRATVKSLGNPPVGAVVITNASLSERISGRGFGINTVDAVVRVVSWNSPADDSALLGAILMVAELMAGE